ncbi:unnamed protein product [Closterium sp. Naga37s-1]|nr:unnamed protein product [Closterium sp. Naga37s-1]
MWAAFRKVSSSRSPHADHSASGNTFSGVVLAKNEAQRLTQRVRRRRLSWGSIWARRGSGSAAAASRSLTVLAHPWGVPTGLPKICNPSPEMGMPGGTEVGSICEADQAAHLAGRLRPIVARSPCVLCLLVFRRSAAPRFLCLVMPVSLGHDFPYSPQPFDWAFAARASSASSASVVTAAEMSSAPAPPPSAPAVPAVRPAVLAVDSPAEALRPVLVPAPACSVPVPPAPEAAPDLPAPVAASVDPVLHAAPSPALVPAAPIQADGSSPLAVSATTGGPAPIAGSGETVHSAPVVQAAA